MFRQQTFIRIFATLAFQCQIVAGATTMLTTQPKRPLTFVTSNRFGLMDRKPYFTHGRSNSCRDSFSSRPSLTAISFFQQQPSTMTHLSLPTTKLYYSRYDSLVAGIAEISLGTSLGVLWSEFAVITTGCGPIQFSDGLERVCYQAVIVFAGLSIFTRIAFQQNLLSWVQNTFGDLVEEPFTYYQVQWAEWLRYTI